MKKLFSFEGLLRPSTWIPCDLCPRSFHLHHLDLSLRLSIEVLCVIFPSLIRKEMKIDRNKDRRVGRLEQQLPLQLLDPILEALKLSHCGSSNCLKKDVGRSLSFFLSHKLLCDLFDAACGKPNPLPQGRHYSIHSPSTGHRPSILRIHENSRWRSISQE